MKLTSNGILFEGYKLASPDTHICRFTDKDGATLLIKTTTLVRMYELAKFDLERNGAWEYVLEEVEEESKNIS